MIYNGEEHWASATHLQFQDTPEELKSYLPHFRFWLIDEKDYANISPDVNNLANALFLMENQPSKEQLLEALEPFKAIFQKRHDEARAFTNWLKWNLFVRRGIEAPEHFTLLEKKDMLADAIDREFNERMALGEARGKAEALAQAHQEKLEIAKKLKFFGLSLEQIQTSTGLPIESLHGL